MGECSANVPVFCDFMFTDVFNLVRLFRLGFLSIGFSDLLSLAAPPNSLHPKSNEPDDGSSCQESSAIGNTVQPVSIPVDPWQHLQQFVEGSVRRREQQKLQLTIAAGPSAGQQPMPHAEERVKDKVR